MSGKGSHHELWRVCHVHRPRYQTWAQPVDAAVYDQCHSCRWHHELAGARALDWGVCFNPRSPRAGLLTFEHMGCLEHEPEQASNERTPEEVARIDQELRERGHSEEAES